MKKSDLIPYHEKVGILLRKAYIKASDCAEVHLKPENLSLRQYSVLCMTAFKGVSLTTLRERLRLDDATTTDLVSSLFLRGLLLRERGGVCLTEKGRESLARATPLLRNAHRELESGFSSREWRDGLDFLMAFGSESRTPSCDEDQRPDWESVERLTPDRGF